MTASPGAGAAWLVAGVCDAEHGATVAPAAGRLAAALGLGVVLVNVIERDPRSLAEDRRRDAVEEARGTLERIAAGSQLPEAQLRVEVGDPAEAIAGAARDAGAEMVVVGTRGGGPVRSRLRGGVSTRLVASLDLPVVIVPPECPAPRERVGTVVCGVDREEVTDVAVRAAGDIARRAGARLVLVHVSADPVLASVPAMSGAPLGHYDAVMEHERRRAHELLSRAAEIAGEPDAEFALAVGDPASRLAQLARREEADLLVVGSHDRGLLGAAVARSTSGVLSAHAPCPVAVVSSPG